MIELALIGGVETEPHPAARVGGKAAGLAAMARLGLPVPPAFVIPIEAAAAIATGKAKALAALDDALDRGIAFLEERTGRVFGDRRRPLLVSVRSGAALSMPGMLETVLDVGASEAAAAGLVRLTGNPGFAADCRRRFVEGWAETVLGLDLPPLPTALVGAGLDGAAIAARLATIAAAGRPLPADPHAQLRAAALAVFASWQAPKAATYRRLHGLEDLAGTAVTVQAMVYGNADGRSAAGVAFSRDPSTGDRTPVVELLFEAQGEDVVSGRRNPESGAGLARRLPQIAERLAEALDRLERAFADVQDVEFTIESGRLWLLQTRAAKRTPRAALKIALDLVDEGAIDAAEAARRLADLDEASLDATGFADAVPAIAAGLPAAPGVAVGRIACSSEAAERLAAAGDPVVLVRPDTTTSDIAGFAAAAAIVTATGGRTAHAALVARQMGRPCVVGCAPMAVDEAARRVRFGDTVLAEGDWLAVDGGDGRVMAGRPAIVRVRPEAEIARWRALVPAKAPKKERRRRVEAAL